jgi:hypothetical protein
MDDPRLHVVLADNFALFIARRALIALHGNDVFASEAGSSGEGGKRQCGNKSEERESGHRAFGK